MKYVYLRDDDVYKSDKSFKRIFATLREYEIPVVYGVIPKLATRSLARFLNKEKRKNPNLTDITQHGWQHANYGGKIKNKYEFGSLRSIAQQRKDILKGYSKMKKLFGKNFTPAFIPPYHGYNGNTLKIIDEIRMPIFSANRKNATKGTKFLNLPINIALNDYDMKGKPIMLKSETMVRRLFTSLNSKGKIRGILFHHNLITTDYDLKEIKKIFTLLKRLEKVRSIKLVLFSYLLKKLSGEIQP